MKRYELAKKEGLNWQVLVIQDCETDIKILILDSVLKGENYGIINKKVMALINRAVKELESETLKVMTKNTLSQYASRIYLEWLYIFGTRSAGIALISLMSKKGINAPVKVVDRLSTLPANVSTDKDSFLPYNRGVANNTFYKSYEKDVQARINKVLDSFARPDYSDRYSLRASAEREIRQEWHDQELKDLKDKGVKLVWIDSHANCSERCEPWQNRLYSLDGTSGEIDGIKYVPLEEATDIYTYTKAGKSYKNGCISGFGCRHRLVPYKNGFRPQAIPREVIDKQRGIEQRQREMERNVRIYTTRALGYREIGNTKAYSHYKNLATNWTIKYKEFSRENNVPFYPSRLDI